MMSKTKKNRLPLNQLVGAAANAVPVAVEIPARILGLIRQENYRDAFDAMRTLPRSSLITHAMGVCAMRFGRADEAVRIFHGMTLNPGTTVVRSAIDQTLKTNYALALLLVGIPSGAMDMLFELKESEYLPAIQIRLAIDNWAASLSFWRRLDWKFNRVDPPNSSVPIDFALGVFPFAVDQVKVETAVSPSSKKRLGSPSKLAV